MGSVAIEADATATLFDATLPLGRMRHITPAAILENIEEVRQRCNTPGAEASPIQLRLVAGVDDTVIREFPRWLPFVEASPPPTGATGPIRG
jgi:hypothetical protein